MKRAFHIVVSLVAPVVFCGLMVYSCQLSLENLHSPSPNNLSACPSVICPNLLLTCGVERLHNTPYTQTILPYCASRHLWYITVEREITLKTGIAIWFVCEQTQDSSQLPFFCLSQAKPSKCHSRLCSMICCQAHGAQSAQSA